MNSVFPPGRSAEPGEVRLPARPLVTNKQACGPRQQFCCNAGRPTRPRLVSTNRQSKASRNHGYSALPLPPPRKQPATRTPMAQAAPHAAILVSVAKPRAGSDTQVKPAAAACANHGILAPEQKPASQIAVASMPSSGGLGQHRIVCQWAVTQPPRRVNADFKPDLGDHAATASPPTRRKIATAHAPGSAWVGNFSSGEWQRALPIIRRHRGQYTSSGRLPTAMTAPHQYARPSKPTPMRSTGGCKNRRPLACADTSALAWANQSKAADIAARVRVVVRARKLRKLPAPRQGRTPDTAVVAAIHSGLRWIETRSLMAPRPSSSRTVGRDTAAVVATLK